MESNNNLSMQVPLYWKFCCCLKCKKIRRDNKRIFLEDFNHAMLRFIYSLYLGVFTALVFISGLILIIPSYFATIFI